MNPNFFVELSDDSAQNVSGGVLITTTTTGSATFSLDKSFKSVIKLAPGNAADAGAAATAYGTRTVAEANTTTTSILGVGSAAGSTSVSVSAPGYFCWF
jgi:hypothetical protein